jgi:hypothetical protein
MMIEKDVTEVTICRKNGIYHTFTRTGENEWREDFYHPEHPICPVCGYHYSNMLDACKGRCFAELDADGNAVDCKFRTRDTLWVERSISRCELVKNRSGKMFFMA